MKLTSLRVDLRETKLSPGLKLVEFALLDEGHTLTSTNELPKDRHCIYYRVESIWRTGSPASEIVDYSHELEPNVLRHLDWKIL